MRDFEFWRTVALAGAAVGQLLFTLLYLTWPWWRRFLGRALFFKATAFTVVLWVALVSRLVDLPEEDLLFTAMYILLGFGVWAQVFAFAHVRADVKRRFADREDDDE